MKLSKKLLSLLLCAIMVLGSVAIGGNGFAEVLDAFSVKASAVNNGCGKNGNNLTWNLSDDGVLTISGAGEMKNYAPWDNPPWHDSKELINTVVINDGVTSIGNHSFEYCYNLVSVTMGNNVTSIGGSAFLACYSLTYINIPYSVTSIGANAFTDCKNIHFSCNADNDIATELHTFISPNNKDFIISFIEDNSEKALRIVKYVGTASTIQIPSIIDGLPVTSIGSSAFEGYTSLTSINIPDSIENIGGRAFCNCTNLTSITIPEGITSIYPYTFCNCKALKTLAIPNKIASIGDGAFSYCTNILSITIPDSVTSIGDSAFESCIGLTSINIPNNVTTIGDYAFYDCTNLTEINWNATSCNDFKQLSSDVFYNVGINGTEIKVTFGDCVEKIPDFLFYKVLKINSITLPDSVKIIGKGAFYGCTDLTSIIISNNVTSIGSGAFYSCSSLKNIDIPKNVTNIGNNAFEYCESLTGNINLPSTLKSIGQKAFYSCHGIINITVPENTTIGENAFFLVNNITGDNNQANAKCLNGYIEENLVYSDSSKKVLKGCTSSAIGDITIPDGVSYIDDYAFWHCDKITSISIPVSVNSIGTYAFSGCESLKDIYFSGSKTDRFTIIIGEENKELEFANWHYEANDPNIAEDGTISGFERYNNTTQAYRSTFTFYANVPEGSSVEWKVSGAYGSYNSDSSFTVNEAKNDFSVTCTVRDSSGKIKNSQSELIKIKHSFWDKLVAFFKLLFNKNAYTFVQK